MSRITRSRTLVAAAVAAAALAGAAQPAAAKTTSKSCTRGGATIQLRDHGTVVVRQKAKRQSKQETRRENVLACWTKTGRRTRIAQEVDLGEDNLASTRVEIVEGRWVGVLETNEGGVAISATARVYDAAKGKLLHDSSVCDTVDQGDYSGPEDVAFLDGGGMAVACDQLVLYRKAASGPEQLEPVGTDLRQLAVSHYSSGFGQRLFWTVGDGLSDTTRSLLL